VLMGAQAAARGGAATVCMFVWSPDEEGSAALWCAPPPTCPCAQPCKNDCLLCHQCDDT
jgi:hypothetical protein